MERWQPEAGYGAAAARSTTGASTDASGASWVRVAEKLRREFGDSVYRSWLARIRLEAVEDGTAILAVGTPFEKDWVEQRYGDRIRVLWAAECEAITGVCFVVSQKGDPRPNGPVRPSASVAALPNAAPSRSAALRVDGGVSVGTPLAEVESEADDDVGAPLDPRLTFESFVTGKPNELAYAAAHRVADSDKVEFNPLYLYGGVGLGKTHLMHAMAWHIRRNRPHRRVVYISAEKFMYRFIVALKQKDMPSFKELFRSVDVLMVDDVQFIGGKDNTQEEFFHTFNALIDQNRQIVLSADKSPADLERIDERLRSRLGWGLVADIHPTTYELRRGILLSKVERMRLDVPDKVLEFLAHRITSNVRELEGALTRLSAYQNLVKRAITLEMAQEVLHDLLRANDRRVTIEDIQKKVAEYFKIKPSEMASARRARDVARPRQVAMYLAKQLTQKSLPEIGRKFGDRDHTTVMHAVKRVQELSACDAAFAEDVDLLKRMLEG